MDDRVGGSLKAGSEVGVSHGANRVSRSPSSVREEGGGGVLLLALVVGVVVGFGIWIGSIWVHSVRL